MTLLAGLFEMRGCWHIGLRWAIIALWATFFFCCKKAYCRSSYPCLLKKARSLLLAIDIQIDMFEKTVKPFPLYGCEVIGTVGWLCWGLTSQSTIFQSCRDIASWVINQYFRGVKCLAQGHNTAAVGFEPRTSRSGVRHSTTEPPRSPFIGTGKTDILEQVQSKFLKLILNLKKSTPNCMVYGETGVMPLKIDVQCRIISY